MKCIAQIVAGACGFRTAVTADSPDDQMVTVTVETDCEKIRGLAAELLGASIDGYREIAAGFDGVILSAARSSLSGCCAGCVVPPGIFKAVQTAAGVALPRDASVALAME